MSAIQDLFQQAQLAEAAYANFTAFSNNPKGALEEVGFSSTQADDFVKHWEVINQYIAPAAILGIGGTGFSATLFKNSQTGAYTFAIRGTEPGYADLLGADFGDIVMDGIAMDQVVDMYNYWQSLNHSKDLN